MPTTRSRSASSKSSGTEADPEATVVGGLPAASTNAEWSKDDKDAFLDWLAEQKAQITDAATFKAPVWTQASVYMEKRRSKGGPKTPKACHGKWDRVSDCANLWGEITDFF